jgi:hypothetical protein
MWIEQVHKKISYINISKNNACKAMKDIGWDEHHQNGVSFTGVSSVVEEEATVKRANFFQSICKRLCKSF